MTDLTCTQPHFEWLGGGWSACTACGRLAWDHEQADPLQDIRNMLRERPGDDPTKYPPAMREVMPDG